MGTSRAQQIQVNTPWDEQTAFDEYMDAMSSTYYVMVRTRIFRQLVESMLFEGIVKHDTIGEENRLIWRIQGVSSTGEPVIYSCRGVRHLTFGRIRLENEPLKRRVGETEAKADSIALFLLEIAAVSEVDEAKVLHFIQELEQTLINDTLAQYKRHQDKRDLHPLPYDEWESGIMEGHPYHPSYKSRIGFDIDDQRAFGPEFAESITPVWLAVRRELARVSHSVDTADPGTSEWLSNQLSGDCLAEFTERIRQAGADPSQYVMLPVHPWQWRTTISSVLAADIRSKQIVPLGIGEDLYTAQQSIRTLANRTSPHRAYLKLSLSILNTSTGRVLAPHTVENAPMISDWLKGISTNDPYLRDELRVILLGEVAGIAYDNSHIPSMLQPKGYGILACIWRESLHPLLEVQESAIPFNALCTSDPDGRPMIAPWIERYGVEQWLAELLRTSVYPIIHYLFAYGIALESHAQNMVLIHCEGRPVRVALKDFHDGIRFMREGLAHPDDCPPLVQVPEYHQRVNRNSFLETNDPAGVRDFVHDAFFFINIGELALFMKEHFSFDEVRFWNMVRQVIENYQQRFPEHARRYELFSLIEPTIGVEQLTKRRLFPDTEPRIHQVSNPLSDSGL